MLVAFLPISKSFNGSVSAPERRNGPDVTVKDWKRRLAARLEASDRSHREISLAAGKGPGYVHSLLSEGKDPTVSNLIAVCKADGISVIYVLAGFELDPELLRELSGDRNKLSAAVASLKSQNSGEARARQAAEHAHRQAVVRADRAEHAERQVTADRDRWRRLALQLEAELKSLRPVSR